MNLTVKKIKGVPCRVWRGWYMKTDSKLRPLQGALWDGGTSRNGVWGHQLPSM